MERKDAIGNAVCLCTALDIEDQIINGRNANHINSQNAIHERRTTLKNSEEQLCVDLLYFGMTFTRAQCQGLLPFFKRWVDAFPLSVETKGNYTDQPNADDIICLGL